MGSNTPQTSIHIVSCAYSVCCRIFHKDCFYDPDFPGCDVAISTAHSWEWADRERFNTLCPWNVKHISSILLELTSDIKVVP